MGSFFLLVTAILLAVLSLLTWPARAAWTLLRRRKRTTRKDVRRIVVVGLDGFDPSHYRRLAERGALPHLHRMEREGAFRELYSTCPPISPVAWSSFATGANPGKHNIFDFLGRDPRHMTIELSSVQIRADRRGRPVVEGRRKSKSFWTVLGEHGVFSHVFRVPLTFPPEPFSGLMLSGLCVPDLRGTQGSFTLCAENEDGAHSMTGGQFVSVKRTEKGAEFSLPGPRVGDRVLETVCRVSNIRDDAVTLHIGEARYELRRGEYSDWIRLSFRARRGRLVTGLCRFCLLETSPSLRLYISPINIDPERPPFPISHPAFYSIYLAKLYGPFATLGLAEDTWALNERVLSEALFLEQVYDIQRERETLFLSMLDRARDGLLIGVFEASDRIQHMYPPDPTRAASPELDDVYRRMDEWVGRVWNRLDPERDVLLVVSDHGFTTFRRGVNLNTWLQQNGYLAAMSTAHGYLRDIDWSRTRAYAFGLSGIYLNLRGREAHGIVGAEERAAVKQQIAKQLRALRDPQTGERAIREVYDSAAVYRGPYTDEAPDLIVGFEPGYRVSWDGAIGRLEPQVFSDNPKHWQGDHCVDYRVVPGVLFCSRPIRADSEIRLMDVAPSILRAFGVEPPRYMDGRAFEILSNGA